MKKIVLVLTMVFFASCMLATSSIAYGYSTVVSLGDSLSDTGNIGRFSDGKIWVELLANHYGAQHINMAYGGATTGYDNPAASLPVTGLNWQADQISAIGQDTLVTLWAGGNDLLQGRDAASGVTNVITALDTLYSAGARDFLIPNLPDIGITPQFQNGPPQLAAVASTWSTDFNNNLESMLQGFNSNHNDINLFLLDTFSIFNSFQNGSPEWAELFWVDGFHPSSKGHQLLFENALAVVVPEPKSLLLFALGLVGAVLQLKRRSSAQQT